jgi:HKD family nuclease
MTAVSSILSKDIQNKLKKADEIWIAVGLLNNRGLQLILDAVPKNCKLNFIVGINLPTDPKALSKLLSLKGKRRITTKILTEDFFHPKVYVVKSVKQLTAFVGSANCTIGGFEENIEMSLVTKDKKVCNKLIHWFDKVLVPRSQLLTADFIKDYKPKYDNRIKRRKKEKEEIDELIENEQIKSQANFKARAKLLSALKAIRRSKDYPQNKLYRQRVIRDLRKCLDYPNFKNIDLDTFFSIKELGTIDRRIVKSQILANRRKFTKLMQRVCDEEIPIEVRIDEALQGKLSIKNIGKGFISKVLVAHNAKKYYLHNDLFASRLRPFGLELPRGLSFGEKYKLTRDILKDVMKETNIDDYATLDHCIWRIKEYNNTNFK